MPGGGGGRKDMSVVESTAKTCGLLQNLDASPPFATAIQAAVEMSRHRAVRRLHPIPRVISPRTDVKTGLMRPLTTSSLNGMIAMLYR